MTEVTEPTPSEPAPEPDAARGGRWRRAAIRLLLLAIAILLLLLLLRPCQPEPPFDYFDAQASQLDDDPQRILAWVRELETLPYRGDLKGPLGALWGKAGSPEEKLALARALLRHAAPPLGREPSLADVADAEPLSDARPLQIAITHLHERGDQPASETALYDGPVGDLVGDVHSIEVVAAGQTRVTLRPRRGPPIVSDIPTGEASGEALRFAVELPGREERLVVRRQLWRAGQRSGPREARASDRHELVVLPCRVDDFVRRQEGVLLAQRQRAAAPEMIGYDALLQYALESDRLLAQVEQRLGVRASFDSPRLLVFSRNAAQGPPVRLDLLLDRTSFSGEPAAARLAACARSLLVGAQAHAYVSQWSSLPASSAFELFARLASGLPRTAAERRAAIASLLGDLAAQGPPARATLRLGDASLEAQATADGARVEGAGLALTLSRDQLADGAAVIEAALVAAAGGPRAHAATLRIESGGGARRWLVPRAQLEQRFERAGRAVRQRVQIRETTGGLEYSFRVRSGLRTARGLVSIDAEPLASATTHDPQYRNGRERRQRATSLVVSRQVAAALRAGQASPFQLLQPRGIDDDPHAPRPLLWAGRLLPDGRGRQAAQINGKPGELPLLYARPEGPEPLPFERLALLDDPRLAVGMADGIRELTTSIHGRLLDEDELPIGGAIVELPPAPGADKPTSVMTRADGRFVLPPPAAAKAYGEVELTVRQQLGDDERAQRVAVDLSAPGLDELVLRAGRLRLELIWLLPADAARLPSLAISPQQRALLAAALRAGRIVALPARMVPTPEGGQEIACYQLDPTSGELVGVLESGLRGPRAGLPGGGDAGHKLSLAAAPSYAMPGEDGLAWGFSAERLGEDRAEVFAALHELLTAWSQRTTLFAEAPAVEPDQALAAMRALQAPTRPAEAQAMLRAGYALALELLAARAQTDR